MNTLEFWIWRERSGFILSDGEHRIEVDTEAQASDAAEGIAQDCNALYRIFYARHIGA